jgi:hypothetical protein
MTVFKQVAQGTDVIASTEIVLHAVSVEALSNAIITNSMLH